jgi:hypothetical protein
MQIRREPSGFGMSTISESQPHAQRNAEDHRSSAISLLESQRHAGQKHQQTLQKAISVQEKLLLETGVGWRRRDSRVTDGVGGRRAIAIRFFRLGVETDVVFRVRTEYDARRTWGVRRAVIVVSRKMIRVLADKMISVITDKMISVLADKTISVITDKMISVITDRGRKSRACIWI